MSYSITRPDGSDVPTDPPDDGWSRGACAYLQGVGSCSFGCWEEPSCHTDYPAPEGWPRLLLHPVHEQNLRARRLAHRTRAWLVWLPHTTYAAPLTQASRRFPSVRDVLAAMNAVPSEP